MFYSNDIKKVVARVAVLGVLLMIAVGCNSSGNNGPPTSSTTAGTAQNLSATSDKLRLGMTEQEVIALVGEPTSKGAVGGASNQFQYRDPEGGELTVTFAGGKLTGWRFTGAGR